MDRLYTRISKIESYTAVYTDGWLLIKSPTEHTLLGLTYIDDNIVYVCGVVGSTAYNEQWSTHSIVNKITNILN